MEDKMKQCIKIAKMYYEENLGQKEIADELDISRPTVSRQLNYAREMGIVEITIHDPYEKSDELARLIQEKYGLKEVIIKDVTNDRDETVLKAISECAAEYLSRTVKHNDIVGVSWGKTMFRVAELMKPLNLQGVETIQLKGGISYSDVVTNSHETLSLFAHSFNSIPRDLPVPVIFDNKEVKKLVSADRHIKSILNMAPKCNIAIYTTGTVRDEALLFKLGFFSKDEVKRLKTSAVGDICSRFYTKDGKTADRWVDDRTMGVTLDTLRKIPTSILVAGGNHKVEAIRGALYGKIPNVLITDSITARKLL
ncbi:sugar-binding transcriptional regulator [Macrococcoides canis]|uniref:sugar-binding transcriptional regulator n=1 Tax=Macrococcoides canis TaxID=1855823 RepID=UPI00207CFC2D|nr:sugar-binding transcriptional regulator [Macrococcus canis]MCO4096804.1 sugar-binding transcriptional regulator [Macrococcus canis]UTH06657.1 sugar-binding transcriptional regulator [Macrococcus canis]UTH09007.1 sugar-binding transcriptional regulator [Macrococcus canis]